MITSKAIPICRSAFQGEYLVSSSPKSVGALGSSSSPKRKSGYGMVTMAYTGGSVKDPYSTLGVSPGATKHEIKKAYRRLALQYHPDVCDGNHCTTSFQQINHAYESLLSLSTPQFGEFEDDLSDNLEGFAGVSGDSWEDWEEWMGWEGAGTRDYSNHVNYAT